MARHYYPIEAAMFRAMSEFTLRRAKAESKKVAAIDAAMILSDETGLDLGKIRQIVSGERGGRIRYSTALKIAAVLGVDPNDIFEPVPPTQLDIDELLARFRKAATDFKLIELNSWSHKPLMGIMAEKTFFENDELRISAMLPGPGQVVLFGFQPGGSYHSRLVFLGSAISPKQSTDAGCNAEGIPQRLEFGPIPATRPFGRGSVIAVWAGETFRKDIVWPNVTESQGHPPECELAPMLDEFLDSLMPAMAVDQVKISVVDFVVEPARRVEAWVQPNALPRPPKDLGNELDRGEI
jgi:hypothetical protein